MQPGVQPPPHDQAKATGLAERVLLCIPRGGMNDALCQIEKSLSYAERFGRQLIIDARQSGLMGQFSDYFSLYKAKVDVLGRLEPHHVELLNTFDCYPEELRGRLEARRYTKTGVVFVDEALEAPLTFDFTVDHPEPLLVHEQSGGGSGSMKLLNRLSLADDVLAIVTERLSALPSEYLGVHVRNTDLKTDYEAFFRDIYPSTIGKAVLICSDDTDVIVHAKQVFDRADVLSTVTPKDRAEKPDRRPLHRPSYYDNDADKRVQTVNSLVDLLALGRASDVLFAQCSNKGGVSGYSRLASYLCSNKPVVASLLSNALTLWPSQVRQLVAKFDDSDANTDYAQRHRQQQERIEGLYAQKRQARARDMDQKEKISALREELQRLPERAVAQEETIRSLREKLQKASGRSHKNEGEIQELRSKLARVRAANARLRSSWSWKVTAPFRSIRAWSRGSPGRSGKV